MTDQDYFPRRPERGETRADAVKRINAERGLSENLKAIETPEQIEERQKREADYLARHDRLFGLTRYSVGDPEGDADVE